MVIRSVLVVVFGLLGVLASGCATATKWDVYTQNFTFKDYDVSLAFNSSTGACVLSDATLKNRGNRPLTYVYTQLLSATSQGATVSSIGINFLPTVVNGTSKPGHVDSLAVAMMPCTSLQMNMTGSAG